MLDTVGGSVALEGLDPTVRATVEHLLTTAREHLSMEAVFLAELTETTQIYRATQGSQRFDIVEGGELPRLESYCQHVMDSNAPWVVPDTAQDARARALAVTQSAGFGAYIGVPVRLPDGRLFGTLCCVSSHPEPHLGERDVAVLLALASALSFHLGQLEQQLQRLDDLRSHAVGLDRALRQAELRVGTFARIVEVSAIPTMVLDPATLTVDLANAAAATVYERTPKELVGSSLWELAPQWGHDQLRGRLAPLVDGDIEVVRLDDATPDAERALDVIVQRIEVDGGDTVLLWTAHDVTGRRETERGLREVDRMRNAFLSAVSHELRTPLMAIQGYVATLRRRASEADDHMWHRLLVNVDRLERLLLDLLDLNQFSHGSIRLGREPVQLDELIRGALDHVETHDRELVLELAPIRAEVAPTKFERIVVNLVANATIHTPPDTEIRVALREQDGGALVVVSDGGPGVPEEARDAVFEPFWQGGTAPPHRPGTGIGLSLVAAFASLHGGRAWVEDAPTGGAAFHVWLPTAAATDAVQ